MKIKDLKVGDVLTEHHPAGYTMPMVVGKRPYKDGDIWYVKTVTRIGLVYIYKQLPNGDILNNGEMITKLVRDEKTD